MSGIWQTGLANNHIESQRYVISKGQMLFTFPVSPTLMDLGSDDCRNVTEAIFCFFSLANMFTRQKSTF